VKKVAILLVLLTWPAAAADKKLDSAEAINDTPRSCVLAEKFHTEGLLEEQSVLSAGFCLGFVIAAWSAMPSGTNCSGPQKPHDIVAIYNAFLRDKPVWRTRRQLEAVQAAITEAFPCPAK